MVYLNCIHSDLIVEKLQMIFSDLLPEKVPFSMMNAKVIQQIEIINDSYYETPRQYFYCNLGARISPQVPHLS